MRKLRGERSVALVQFAITLVGKRVFELVGTARREWRLASKQGTDGAFRIRRGHQMLPFDRANVWPCGVLRLVYLGHGLQKCRRRVMARGSLLAAIVKTPKGEVEVFIDRPREDRHASRSEPVAILQVIEVQEHGDRAQHFAHERRVPRDGQPLMLGAWRESRIVVPADLEPSRQRRIEVGGRAAPLLLRIVPDEAVEDRPGHDRQHRRLEVGAGCLGAGR